jgi:serine/threonine protein kinase
VAEDYSGWEKIRPLGSGGQSDVFLVRSPNRARQRGDALGKMRPAFHEAKMEEFSTFVWNHARPDELSELGALKVFKPRSHGIAPEEQQQEQRRYADELEALSQIPTGLPKMLAHGTRDHWIVTEYFPDGSLEGQISKYKGNAKAALVAFRSLVETAKLIHERKWVHRDIKPANVFARTNTDLVLGDFGIVFFPDSYERMTATHERVGPRDYMPQWADLGERLEEVTPAFDVYMLGKLLWCMVAGKLKLPREYHRRPSHDLEKLFPDSPWTSASCRNIMSASIQPPNCWFW